MQNIHYVDHSTPNDNAYAIYLIFTNEDTHKRFHQRLKCYPVHVLNEFYVQHFNYYRLDLFIH